MKNVSIEVINEFEGAMIGDYYTKEKNLFMTLKREKPTFGYRDKEFDYNLHFNFGLKNLSNDEKEITVFIGCSDRDELQNSLPWLWVSDDFNKEYELTKNISGKTDFHGKYFFKIVLRSKQVIYIANFPPKGFNKLKKDFQDLSFKTKAQQVIIGKTVQGRNIIAYEYGDIKTKPTILIVSGFHPPERDTLAIETIMEKFLDDQWKKKIFKNYSFSFIPLLNPDGFANSMQGSNINEINFHWKFFGNSMNECPEAHNIWEYCSRIKPIVFFDFHAFTFQNNNPRPYLIPEGYYVSKKSKLIQNYYNSKLSKLCGLSENNKSRNEVILAPTLLATRLRNRFGTITVPKFHLHMKNGLEESRQMALDCLEIICEGLSKYDINSSGEILKIPYGEIKTTVYDKLRINMLNFWYFKLIPLLKKILYRSKN